MARCSDRPEFGGGGPLIHRGGHRGLRFGFNFNANQVLNTRIPPWPAGRPPTATSLCGTTTPSADGTGGREPHRRPRSPTSCAPNCRNLPPSWTKPSHGAWLYYFRPLTKLHSTTKPLEPLNGEVKRRTDVVGIFGNEGLPRLVRDAHRTMNGPCMLHYAGNYCSLEIYHRQLARRGRIPRGQANDHALTPRPGTLF